MNESNTWAMPPTVPAVKSFTAFDIAERREGEKTKRLDERKDLTPAFAGDENSKLFNYASADPN